MNQKSSFCRRFIDTSSVKLGQERHLSSTSLKSELSPLVSNLELKLKCRSNNEGLKGPSHDKGIIDKLKMVENNLKYENVVPKLIELSNNSLKGPNHDHNPSKEAKKG